MALTVADKRQPVVTVIIPAYRAAATIGHCLASVQRQSYPTLEILIIDNASPDETLQVVRSCAQSEPRARVISNERNRGYGYSVNLGIEQARGQYMAIVEADDYLEPTAVGTLLNLIRQSRAQIVKTNYYRWTASRNQDELVDLFLSEEKDRVINVKNQPHLLTRHACLWAGLYDLTFLRASGIKCVAESSYGFQDTAFNFETLVAAARVYCCPQAFYHYRVDNPSQTTRSRHHPDALEREYQVIGQFLQERQETNRLAGAYTAAKFYGYKWNLERLPLGAAGAFARRAQRDFQHDQQVGLWSLTQLDDYGRTELQRWLTHPYAYLSKTKLAKLIRKGR